MKGAQTPVNHQVKMFYFRRQRPETMRLNPERLLARRPRGDLVTLYPRPSVLPAPPTKP